MVYTLAFCSPNALQSQFNYFFKEGLLMSICVHLMLKNKSLQALALALSNSALIINLTRAWCSFSTAFMQAICKTQNNSSSPSHTSSFTTSSNDKEFRWIIKLCSVYLRKKNTWGQPSLLNPLRVTVTHSGSNEMSEKKKRMFFWNEIPPSVALEVLQPSVKRRKKS